MNFLRSGFLLAIALACLPVAAGLAEESKPVIATKTKSAEIEVSIEDSLKAHAGLYDNLLAEAKRDAAKWQAAADQAKEHPFKTDGHYEYTRGYTERSVIGAYVSVLRTDSTFLGGAHPNSLTDTILWDTSAKKRISIRPFFKDASDNGATMSALAKLVRAAVYAEKKERDRPVEANPDKDSWLKGIEPSLLKLGPVTLAPSTEPNKSAGLTFHFSPYAVGPYVEGSLTAFVPWTAFKDHLSPEGVALFGGDRPEGDAATLD